MNPRHDDDAERMVLGSLLADPRVLDEVVATGLEPGDFYQPAHELVFAAILDASRAMQPHDPVAIAGRLGVDRRRMPSSTYLVELPDAVVSTASAGYHARTIVAEARLRRMQAAAVKMHEDATNASADTVDAVVQTWQTELDARTSSRASSGLPTFAALMDEAIERWETPETNVLPTGLADLDAMLNGGLRPGHLCVIAARPAVGKSLAATVIAANVIQTGGRVLVSSLEMSQQDVVDRVSANVAGVDLERLVTSTPTDPDWVRLSKARARAEDWPLWVDDRPKIPATVIRSTARDTARAGGLDLLIVDYLQIVAPAKDSDPRHLQVGRIAEDLRAVGKELGVPVVALAQINRESMKRTDSRPTMADIRESGAIEAHADEIILLHRDDEESPGEIEFNLEKNRNGRTGRVAFAWAPHHSRISDMARWQTEAS